MPILLFLIRNHAKFQNVRSEKPGYSTETLKSLYTIIYIVVGRKICRGIPNWFDIDDQRECSTVAFSVNNATFNPDHFNLPRCSY